MVLLLRAATIESGYKRKEMVVVCVCFDAPPPKLYCNFAKGKRTGRTTRVGIRVGPWLSSCRHGVQHTNTKKYCWLVSTNNKREGFFSPLSYSYLVDKEDHRLSESRAALFSLLISHFNNFLQSNEQVWAGGTASFLLERATASLDSKKKEWPPTYMSVPLCTYCLRLGSRSQVPDSLQQVSLGALNFARWDNIQLPSPFLPSLLVPPLSYTSDLRGNETPIGSGSSAFIFILCSIHARGLDEQQDNCTLEKKNIIVEERNILGGQYNSNWGGRGKGDQGTNRLFLIFICFFVPCKKRTINLQLIDLIACRGSIMNDTNNWKRIWLCRRSFFIQRHFTNVHLLKWDETTSPALISLFLPIVHSIADDWWTMEENWWLFSFLQRWEPWPSLLPPANWADTKEKFCV